jgi:hypothetical protein
MKVLRLERFEYGHERRHPEQPERFSTRHGRATLLRMLQQGADGILVRCYNKKIHRRRNHVRTRFEKAYTKNLHKHIHFLMAVTKFSKPIK